MFWTHGDICHQNGSLARGLRCASPFSCAARVHSSLCWRLFLCLLAPICLFILFQSFKAPPCGSSRSLPVVKVTILCTGPQPGT